MLRREFLTTPVLGLLIPAGDAGSRLGDVADNPGLPDAEGRSPGQRLHQDFETYTPGIEHYFLGNGDIQAVIQHSPDQSGPEPQTFLGLTLMDAGRFARKWSTLLFHPERGLERSAITVQLEDRGYRLSPENVISVGWTYPDGVPTVVVCWNAGVLTVEEQFFVPSKRPMLYRTVTLRKASPGPLEALVQIQLVPSFALFDEISTDPSQARATADGYAFLQLYTREPEATASGRYDLQVPARISGDGNETIVRFVYSLSRELPDRIDGLHQRIRTETVEYWQEKTMIRTGNEVLDHLVAVSRTCQKAGTSRDGRRDSGIWMYNMEWIRDDLFTALAMLHTGFHSEAKIILSRILEKSVGEDGRTLESSRWYGYEYTELDQNGEILFGIWSYLCWTGDEEFVRKHWQKIRTVAEFPIQDVFRDPESGLLHNKREFWERNDAFGVVEGYELMHQFWVSLGLERIAEVAARLGDPDSSRRWRDIGQELRTAMLEDPKLRFIEDGHLIKRRTRAGEWQRLMMPVSRKSMPPGSPIATEPEPMCEPDSASVYPIIYGLVPSSSELATRTMQQMEALWNQRWTMGGYSRYNVSSEPDLPGPWPITTALIARAYVETGNSEMAWRALNWLGEIHGGQSGWWFERYAPSITPPAPPVSVCGWIWPEILLLITHNLMGVRPEIDRMVIRPRLIDGIDRVSGRFSIRSSDVRLAIRRTGEGFALVNGEKLPIESGTLIIPHDRMGARLDIDLSL